MSKDAAQLAHETLLAIIQATGEKFLLRPPSKEKEAIAKARLMVSYVEALHEGLLNMYQSHQPYQGPTFKIDPDQLP